MPVRSATLVSALAIALSGCMPQQGIRQDPFAGLTAPSAPSPYRHLTLAVIPSKNTKELIAHSKKLETPGPFTGRYRAFHLDEIVAVLQKDFGSVARVEDITDPRAATTDLVAVIDAYAFYPSSIFGNVKLDVRADFVKSSIAVASLRVGSDLQVRANSPGGMGVTRMNAAVEAAEREIRGKFEEALLASAELKQFAAARGPQAAPALPAVGQAEAPILSDVDRPTFRLKEKPADFAMVVGIEKYSNDLPAALFAERDARAVKEHLLALGYPERNIKFLIGDRASRANLEAYLEDWLPRNVTEDSRVFFYFSGHGAPNPESGQAYLVPWDGNPNFLEKTAYPVKKLYAGLNGLKARQVVVALDSCFSGAGGRSVLAEGVRPLVAKVDASVSTGGKIVLFAAASAQGVTSSLKEQGHGIFTYFFLKGLGGAAKDPSGAVTPRGLYDFLKPKVQDSASRQNRDQTPVLEGAMDGEIARFE